MKRIYLIMLMIVAMMVSCNPKDEDDNNNSGGNGNNGGGSAGEIAGEIAGHGYVDLGLPSGKKWATCNVGATSAEDYGDYFAWGETISKAEYAYENSVTYGSYWSSTPAYSDSYHAYDLDFRSSEYSVYCAKRSLGQTVRPVSE